MCCQRLEKTVLKENSESGGVRLPCKAKRKADIFSKLSTGNICFKFIASNFTEALKAAMPEDEDGVLIVCGSFYLVSEARQLIRDSQFAIPDRVEGFLKQ